MPQPIATTPPGTQIPTPVIPQPLIISIPTAAPLVVPIAVPSATPIAAPTTPATPPGPQSSNYDQLLWSRERQPRQLQQLHTHTPPEPAVPSVEQGPRQGPALRSTLIRIIH